MLHALQEQGMVLPDRRPLIPELFWELSEFWVPTAFRLLGHPDLDHDAEQFDLGLENLAGPGWAVTDTKAAQAYGVPLMASGDYPPDFYAADKRTALLAVRRFGEAAQAESRQATVAIPPFPLVVQHRSPTAPVGLSYTTW